MAEGTLSLYLDAEQRLHFFAHLLVYLSYLIANPMLPRQRARFDFVQEVAYRLLHPRADKHPKALILLNAEEAQAIKDALKALQLQYDQWPSSETKALACEHLTACRLLVEKAEQQADTKMEGR